MVRSKRSNIRLRKGLNHSGRRFFPTTGFTLLEVVVAMAILGIGLTVILELFSGGLRLARTSVEYTQAVNYARMKMEEMRVKQTIEEGSEEGELDGTFRWQVETKRVDILPAQTGTDYKPPVDLFRVKVNVLWKSGTKERSTSLETYRVIKLQQEESQG
jgi:general secretion pathway protein I